MRSFSRENWNRAQGEWRAGEFSDEWRDFRHQAAMRGFIFPPSGTPFDSWEDDNPSQRAILIRAIRETPALLSELIGTSRSWSQVIDKLTRRRDEWREQQRLEERHVEDDGPSEREALQVMGDIFRRIKDSVA